MSGDTSRHAESSGREQRWPRPRGGAGPLDFSQPVTYTPAASDGCVTGVSRLVPTYEGQSGVRAFLGLEDLDPTAHLDFAAGATLYFVDPRGDTIKREISTSLLPGASSNDGTNTLLDRSNAFDITESDSVNRSVLVPTFSMPDGGRAFVGFDEQAPGVTSVDSSAGTVEYRAADDAGDSAVYTVSALSSDTALALTNLWDLDGLTVAERFEQDSSVPETVRVSVPPLTDLTRPAPVWRTAEGAVGYGRGRLPGDVSNYDLLYREGTLYPLNGVRTVSGEPTGLPALLQFATEPFSFKDSFGYGTDSQDDGSNGAFAERWDTYGRGTTSGGADGEEEYRFCTDP